MLIAIHPDKIGSVSYSEKWVEFLRKRNIEVKWVDLTAIDALEPPNDKQLAKRILYIIEKSQKQP